jgi:membrane protease YdiL (CAAX protease family)
MILTLMLGIYFKNSRQLSVSLVMVVPLLVSYELGLLVVGWQALNGADLLTQQLLTHLGGNGFLIFNLVLILGFVGAVSYLRKKGSLDYRYFLPLIIESGIYATLLGSTILFVMQTTYLLGVPDALAASSPLTRIVISAGAGLHEELVFRLGLISAIAFVWPRIPGIGSAASALPVAVIASSILFALAHYLVDPFAWFSFWYRTIAGLIFAGIYLGRGFAVAAYTHTLYDIYILLFK